MDNHVKGKNKTFGVNDEVFILDTEIYDEPTWIHGKVEEVGEETISVKWHDLDEPTEYELSNLPDIRFKTPTPVKEDKSNEAINDILDCVKSMPASRHKKALITMIENYIFENVPNNETN